MHTFETGPFNHERYWRLRGALSALVTDLRLPYNALRLETGVGILNPSGEQIYRVSAVYETRGQLACFHRWEHADGTKVSEHYSQRCEECQPEAIKGFAGRAVRGAAAILRGDAGSVVHG